MTVSTASLIVSSIASTISAVMVPSLSIIHNSVLSFTSSVKNVSMLLRLELISASLFMYSRTD